MDASKIIKRNKEKRNAYYDVKNPKELTPKVKYLKNLISRALLAIIFVLASVIFINKSSENKELYQKYVLENSLSFTKINNLYQKVFGKVDVFTEPKEDTQVFFNAINYASMENYKNGVKLNVKASDVVNVITSGIVVYIGEKDDLGNTIIIQGNDGVDIWYSNITDTDIKIYDYIEAGAILGTASSDYIYLTINKDGKYISYEEYQKLI